MKLKNAYHHFRTITRHRHAVIRNCFRAGIPWQGLLHDLSKYSPTEFLAGVKYYQGYRSPNEGEREDIGYSAAWMHHKGRNRHHFEYWTDYHPVERRLCPIPMPTRYVIEMFCDRVAASRIYKGDAYTDDCPLEYFMRAKATRFIAPETSDMIEGLLAMLAEQGEEKTFEYVRSLAREDRAKRRKQKY